MEERIPSIHMPPLPRTPRRSPSKSSLRSEEGTATTPREDGDLHGAGHAPDAVFHDPGHGFPRSESTKLKMRRRSEFSAVHGQGHASSPPSRRGTMHPDAASEGSPSNAAVGETSTDPARPSTIDSERQEVAQALRELRDHLHHDRIDMQFPRQDAKTGAMHLQRSTTQLTKEERIKLVKYAKRSRLPVGGTVDAPSSYSESAAAESPGVGGKPSGTVCAQMDWWDGRFPSHRSTTLPPQSVRPARFMCGAYFTDVSENTFLAKEVVCSVAEHVDNALRLSGLIKQLGTYFSWPRGSIPVLFDEAQWMWVHATERWPMKGGALPSSKIKDRADYVPHGIISVVGSLDVGSFCNKAPKPVRSKKASPNLAKSLAAAKGHRKRSLSTSGDRKAAKDHRGNGTDPAHRPTGGKPQARRGTVHDATLFAIAATERKKQEAEAMRHTGYDVQPYDDDDKDEQMIMVIGDPDSEFLSPAEVLKHIKHYLTRSVIKAAKTAGASVIVSGTDDLARQLGIGYQAFLDPEGIKSAKAGVATQLVGINARCDCDAVNLNFSHNILLQADGGHEIVLSKWGSSDCLECTRCRKTDRDNDFAIDGFCPQHPDYAAVRAASVEAADMPSTAHVSKDEIRAYKLRMLESLHSGHYQRLVRDSATVQAPNRDAIPVLLIAFGGDETTRAELHTAALRGWPILIVEGSGGYADVLCSTINSINTLTPDASTDDFRTMLTAVDAETSAIISKGQYQIIRKGELIGQVERTILTALKGDEILHMAWKWYSSWHFNETQWLYYHQLHQLTVLLLGIYATLASVTQTFLILLYRERAVDDDDFINRWANDEVLSDEKYWYMMFRLQQWLVIGLPITLTLLHAIFQRMNPWAKLCAFRVASTSLLSEIYMYRTRTMGYSTEAVKKSRAQQGLGTNDGPLGDAQTGAQRALRGLGTTTAAPNNTQQQAVDPKDAQENSAIGSEPAFLYGSREELLGHKMRQIQQTLGTTEAGQVKLEVPLDTNVPPSSITKTGDGGLGDLTPDNYLKFRVTAVRQAYFRRHNQLDGQQSLLTFLVIFFGATGTALAALSAYGLGYLQAWVAFSTVVVNSLTRFLDFTRITAMSELCNTAEHRLSDVERWWSSVGTDADSDRNRTTLVSDAEHIIKCELEGWSKQMQSMDRDKERRGDRSDRAAAKAEMLSKQELAHDRKAQGTEMLQDEAILRGLQDKSGAMAQKVKRQIIDLNDKLGGFVRVVQSSAVPGPAAAPRLGGHLQALRDSAASKNRKRREEFPVPQAFLEKRARTAFLNLLKPDQFLDYRWLTSFSLRQSLGLLSPRAADALSGIHDVLHVTAIAKRIILDQFEDQFMDVLASIPEDVRDSLTMEEFVTEMHHMHVVFGSQLRHVTKESLAQVMDNVAVKEAILLMRKPVFDRLIELCRMGFAVAVVRRELKPLSWEAGVGSLSTLMVMLNGVGLVEANERIHVRILNGGNDETVATHITKMIDTLNQQALPLDLTTKQEILSLLSPQLLSQWNGLSGFQLLQMMRVIACGTAASRCVNAAAVLLRAQCKDGGDGASGLIEWVNEPSRREIFVAANELLTQLVINRSSKMDLIRSMQAAKAMTREFADSLSEAADEPTLKAMLSVLQAQQSNSFAAQVVQRLADSFFLVDYEELLTGDEIECLTCSVSLLPDTFAVGGLSKDALLQIVPLSSLRHQLEVLDEQQLQMLIHVQRLLMAPRYYNVVWDRVQHLGGIGSLARQCIMRAIHPHAAQRLIFLATYMSRQEMLDLGLCLSTAKILQQLGDAMVTQCLFGLCDDPTQETSYAMELGRIIEDAFLLTHDEERSSGSTHGQHRTGDRLLVHLCHRMIGMQPVSMAREASMRHYAELFFRMHHDPLSVDLNAMYRLVRVRADDLLLLDDEDNHESEFGDGGHRNSGIEDMLEVFSLTPAELSDAAQLGRGLENIRSDLYASLNHGDEYSLVRRMRNMLVEMDIFLDLELPYMMFEETCHCCTQFDLRDVVVNSTDRHVFAVSWFEFLSTSDGVNLPVLCDVCKVPLLNNDKDLGVAASESKAQIFKETLMRALIATSRTQDTHDAPHQSSLQYADLDLLIRTVRALQDPHVVQLALVLEKLLLKSSAGRVFEWYCVNRRERDLANAAEGRSRHQMYLGQDTPTARVLSLEQVASHVLSIARGNRSSIAAAFFKFDARQFVQHKTQHHEAHLRQIIPNDSIVDTLLQMSEKQLRWLFIMISFTLDAEERKMREDEATAKSLRQRFAASLAQKRSESSGAANAFAKVLAETTALYDDDVDSM